MNHNNYIQETIKGCITGDPECQRTFVREYSGFLYAICKRYVKDTESAKDLVQESLIKILDKIHLYDSTKGEFKSWMSTVTIRVCLSSFKKKRIVTVDLKDTYTEEIQFDAQILHDLSMQELYALIHKLPFNFREVFNLHVIDGYSHQEIGELLNIGIGSSRTRLFRAKAILRKQIQIIKKQESCITRT